MSMPRSWVEALFKRLHTRYGVAFMRQYEGTDPEAVKDDWQFVLSRCTPEMIRYGLEYLPADKPPNVAQFAMICNRAPTVEVVALPGPPPDPGRVVELIGRMKDATEHGSNYCVQTPERVDPKAWARRLQRIELEQGGILPSGNKMTRAQREMWRTALESEIEA